MALFDGVRIVLGHFGFGKGLPFFDVLLGKIRAMSASGSALTQMQVADGVASSDAVTVNQLTQRGLPVGGTSGQALVKSSGTDYAVTWATVSSPALYKEYATSATAPTVGTGQGQIAIGDGATVSGTSARAVCVGRGYASGLDSMALSVGDSSASYGATGQQSVAINYRAKASQFCAMAVGAECQAAGNYTFAHGFQAVASVAGKKAYASGSFSAAGDAQGSRFILRRAATDATTVYLTTAGGTSQNSSDQISLPNFSALAFHGTIVARQKGSDGTQSAAWIVSGLLRREGGAAFTVLVTSSVTVISNAPGWTISLAANTTNGGLNISFSGVAATNVRCVASIDCVEVTYP